MFLCIHMYVCREVELTQKTFFLTISVITLVSVWAGMRLLYATTEFCIFRLIDCG